MIHDRTWTSKREGGEKEGKVDEKCKATKCDVPIEDFPMMAAGRRLMVVARSRSYTSSSPADR